jgi:hypothetical protein
MTRDEFLDELDAIFGVATVDCSMTDIRWSAWNRESAILADKMFPMSDHYAKV